MSLLSTNPSDRYRVSVVSDEAKASLTKPVSELRRATRSSFTRVFSGVLVAMMGFLLLVGGAAPASAFDPVGDGFTNAFCSSGNFNYGVKTKTQDTGTHSSPDDRTKTPFEKYGMTGTDFTVWQGPQNQEGFDDEGTAGGRSLVAQAGGEQNTGGLDNWGDGVQGSETSYPAFYNIDKQCLPVIEIGMTAVANAVFWVSKGITYVTATVFQFAYEESSSVTSLFEPTIEATTDNLKAALYIEFLSPVLMGCALYLAYIGLVRKESTRFVQGFGWMIGMIIAATLLFSFPLIVPKTIDSGISTLSQALITSVASPAPDPAKQDLCYVDPASSENDARHTVRVVQCQLWYSFVYTPWVQGQFGSGGPGAINAGWPAVGNIGEPLEGTSIADGVLVGGQQIKNDWALTYLDSRVVSSDSTPELERLDKQRTQLNVSAAMLHRDGPNRSFSGEQYMDRGFIAGTALVGSVSSGILIGAISLSIIMFRMAIFLLSLFAVVFFLVGIHPGRGKSIFLSYLEFILGLAIKAVVLSFVLGVMILFYQIIMVAALPWIITMLIIVGLTFAAFAFKNPLLDTFGKVSLGGDASFGSVIQQVKGNAGGGVRSTAALAAAGAGLAATGSPSVGAAASRIGRNSKSAQPAPTNKGAGARKNSQSEHRSSRVGGPSTSESASSSSQTDPASSNRGAGDRPAESRTTTEGEPSRDQHSNNGAGERPAEWQEPNSEKEPSRDHRSTFDPEGPADHNWAPSAYSKQEETPGFVRGKLNEASARRVEQQHRKDALLRNGYESTAVTPGMMTMAVAQATLEGISRGSVFDGVVAGATSVVKARAEIKSDNAPIVARVERHASADQGKLAEEKKNPPPLPKPVKVPSQEEALKQAKENSSKAPKSSFTPTGAGKPAGPPKPAESRPVPPAQASKAGKPLPDSPGGNTSGAGGRPA